MSLALECAQRQVDFQDRLQQAEKSLTWEEVLHLKRLCENLTDTPTYEQLVYQPPAVSAKVLFKELQRKNLIGVLEMRGFELTMDHLIFEFKRRLNQMEQRVPDESGSGDAEQVGFRSDEISPPAKPEQSGSGDAEQRKSHGDCTIFTGEGGPVV
ncbi:hypothetical protein Bbelb_249110 [Branchiostoma belcheri]|nr:hypothetical protein Bbelb_249110 [Branchiostoma belcheri]